MQQNEVIQLNRRQFIKTTAVAAGGLSLGIVFNSASADDGKQAAPGEAGSTELHQAEQLQPNAFIRINADNTVTVLSKHLEMGQGSYTGMATLVADEMDADWSQIRVEGAPANTPVYKNFAFGIQGTGGSTSMANAFMQMREAGAAAKAMLVAAAAAQWQVVADEISVKAGVVSHASGKQATFGELAEAAAQQALPAKVSLKTPDQFIYIGKNNLRRVDTSAKTNGTAQYTQDVNLPNMKTAVVAHSPRFGGKVKSVDDAAAKAIKGVVEVVQIPTGVAVIANDFWSAKKGRDALNIEWDDSAAYQGSSDAEMARYQDMARKPGAAVRKEGNPASVISTAHRVLSSQFEFPYLAHAAMEPMNCVVHLSDGRCEIWNGDQMQTLDQGGVAAITGVPPENVVINTLYAGGSFGRRGNPHSDYIFEAAHIAKASANQDPIKMVWTREDDMRAGYYRPMFFHDLRGSLDADGNLLSWEQTVVGQSIMKGTPMDMVIQNGIDPMSVEGCAEPYAIPNLELTLHTPDDVGVPVQWWRSVGHTHTGFATECFMDQLAHAAGKDPVEFRRAMLKDHPRHLAVLELAAEKSGWGSELPPNRGRGIALVKSFNSYVAEVAEVTVNEDGSFSVDKITLAVDCGIVVNPDVVYAQMGGGVGYALSAALGEKITLKDGEVVQSNFHDYTPLRMPQMPKVEVHIVASGENPSGVGEPSVPPLAPAVANALFAVTGKRIQSLPIGRTV